MNTKSMIRFPDGTSVEWVDKETLRYSQGVGSALIWVDFEPGFFSRGRVVKTSSIKKWETRPPDEPEEISNNFREIIIDKVKKYYEQYKVKCRIET